MAFLSANQGPIERLLARGAEWRRQHGDKPVPMKVLRAWSLPTRKATSAERQQWLEAITANAEAGNGHVEKTKQSMQWCPPLTASPAPFAPFDVDQVLGLLNKSLAALRSSNSTRFYASIGVGVQQLRDSLDADRFLNDPSVSLEAVRAMLMDWLEPFMTAADSNRLNSWELLFRL